MSAGQRQKPAGDVRVAQLLPEVRAGRQPKKPDAADSLGAETFPQDGVARTRLFRRRDLGAVQRVLNLAQDGRFDRGAHSADRITAGSTRTFFEIRA